MNINIKEIIKSIPHRYPMLLVDKIKSIDLEKKEIIGIKNVTFNEPHFTGHFPDHPIMPGVLIIEALAQTSAVMVTQINKEKNEDKLVYFMAIDKVKFRKPVVPGDVLELHIKTIQNRGNVWKFHGDAMVEGKKVAEANFAAMIVDKNN
jgi:3-hydroxyacyl-[acyl-carrier-protein] dehydratase